MKNILFISTLLLFSVITILAISSCISAIDERMVNNVKDEVPPVVEITSPAEGSYCANIVEVTGRATDSSTASGKPGELKSIGYSVTGTTVSGQVALTDDGSFTFQFSTTTLGETFTLNVVVEDWNDNRTTVLLPLRKLTENNVPSFEAKAGNREVELRWSLYQKRKAIPFITLQTAHCPLKSPVKRSRM